MLPNANEYARVIERELEGLSLAIEGLIESSDVVRRLKIDLECAREEAADTLESLNRTITNLKRRLEQALEEYITISGHLIIFSNHSAISAQINRLIANIRDVARSIATTIRTLITKVKAAIHKATPHMLGKLSQAGSNLMQAAIAAEPIALVQYFDGETILREADPMLWDFAQSYSEEAHTQMKNGVVAVTLAAEQLIKTLEQKSVKTLDVYAEMAMKFSGLVKSKTPGPKTVKLAIRLLLKDNAFDFHKQRFVAQGSRTLRRVGLHAPGTRVINSVLNYGIKRGTRSAQQKVRSMALRQIDALLTNVLVSKRVPRHFAEAAAGRIVSALNEKFPG